METNTAFAQLVAPSIDVIKAKQKATWEDGNNASFEPAIRKRSGRRTLPHSSALPKPNAKIAVDKCNATLYD